jgi:hypothetical protein
MLYFWKKENSLLDFMKKILVLLLVVSVQLFSSCEKDDICDPNTPTTPRLIIDFYNIEDPTKTKNVTDLAIVGEWNDYRNSISFRKQNSSSFTID